MALPKRPSRFTSDAPMSRDKLETPRAPIKGEEFYADNDNLLLVEGDEILPPDTPIDITPEHDEILLDESTVNDNDESNFISLPEESAPMERSRDEVIMEMNAQSDFENGSDLESSEDTPGEAPLGEDFLDDEITLVDVDEATPVRPPVSKEVEEDEYLTPKRRLEAFNHVVDSELHTGDNNPEDLLEGKRARVTQRLVPVEKKEVRKTHYRGAQWGGISTKHALEGNYEIYAHLEDKIHDMVEQIQETLSEQGESQNIGMARRKRNSELYYQMYQKVDRLITRALSSNDGVSVEPIDTQYFTAAVNNEILGFGPLEPLWQDNDISEVMVNGPKEVRVEKYGKTFIATGIRFRDEAHAMKVANNFLGLSDRTFSNKMPYADGSLPDGSRLNAIHPEIAPGGPYLTIRRFPDTIFSMEKLVNLGSLDETMATLLGNYAYLGVSIVIGGGTGTGKALCLKTLIPTPAGMIPLGELCVGDTVFDENGQLTKITGFFPQGLRPSYLVKFSDNSSVIADLEHNWYVKESAGTYGSKNSSNYVVKTTAELLDGIDNTQYEVPLTKPVQYAAQELPVDPYLLGFWIACGNSNGRISGENRNVEDVLSERGIKFSRVFDRIGGDSVLMLEIEGFRDQLIALGLLSAENDDYPVVLPEAYLIASEGQRKALLAGILDNGGILHRRNGYIEFIISGNDRFATQIARLLGSLGISAKRQELAHDKGNMINIAFETASEVFACKDLTEAHQKAKANNSNQGDHKYITEIKPVGDVEVACISVDSPNHLYLFGNEHTVTHNTSMLNALSGCIPQDQRIITVEDTLELQLHPDKHVLSLRSRPANAKGEDAVTIRDLVRNTLRMRPDRIIVGEVRDASAYDMMQALNTGHEGSLTTTHASNPMGTIERLSLLTSEAGEVTPERALSLIAGAVDIIVNIERYPEDGSRRVSTISEVPSELKSVDGRLVLEPTKIWEWKIDHYDKDEHKLYGHYEKVGEISDSLKRKHSLEKRQQLTLDEIYKISKVPEVVKGDH